MAKLHAWQTAPSGATQPYTTINASLDSHKFLMGMSDDRSGARAALNLTGKVFPADFGAACGRLLGWSLDDRGVAVQNAAANVQMQLLLCRQQLAASQVLINHKDLQLASAMSLADQHDRASQAAETGRRAAEAALEAARQEATRAEAARRQLEAEAEAASRAAAKALADAQARLREGPRTRREQSAAQSAGDSTAHQSCCGSWRVLGAIRYVDRHGLSRYTLSLCWFSFFCLSVGPVPLCTHIRVAGRE